MTPPERPLARDDHGGRWAGIAKHFHFRRLSVTPLCLVLFVLGVTESGCVARRLWIDKGGMTETDKEECAALMTPVRARFTFPASLNPFVAIGEPAAFCGIEGRGVFFPTLHTKVMMYGITDRATQEGILATLKESRRDGFKPLIVRFYENEQWAATFYPDGTQRSLTHEIDQEKLLRQAVFR